MQINNAREIAAKLIPHTTSVHNVMIIQSAIDAAVAPYKEALLKLSRHSSHDELCSSHSLNECDCGYVDAYRNAQKLLGETNADKR